MSCRRSWRAGSTRCGAGSSWPTICRRHRSATRIWTPCAPSATSTRTAVYHLNLRHFPRSGILDVLGVRLRCPRSRSPASPGVYGRSPAQFRRHQILQRSTTRSRCTWRDGRASSGRARSSSGRRLCAAHDVVLVELGHGQAGVVGQHAQPGADRRAAAEDAVLLGQRDQPQVVVQAPGLVVGEDPAKAARRAGPGRATWPARRRRRPRVGRPPAARRRWSGRSRRSRPLRRSRAPSGCSRRARSCRGASRRRRRGGRPRSSPASSPPRRAAPRGRRRAAARRSAP